MPHHDENRTVSGTITEVFFHRFVVKTDTGSVLADITPKGAERITLEIGDRVTLSGEMKPSELKVDRYVRADGKATVIEHKKPHQEHAPVDPAPALKTASSEGYRVIGEPRRKPKHFEILGRGSDGHLSELHIELDGRFRHLKPIDEADPKWRDTIDSDAQQAA